MAVGLDRIWRKPLIALTDKKSRITDNDVIELIFDDPVFLNLFIRNP